MKKTFSLLAALVLIIAGGAASAFGQNAAVKVSIPFAFNVGSSTLSAGDYTFAKLSPNVWSIRNERTHQSMLATATANGANNDSNLGAVRFKQLGDSYFLSEVRCFGQTSAVGPSKAQRELERETARNGDKPGSIVVAASAR